MADEKDPGCIDELIGPKLKAAGIRCPCPKHTPSGTEEVPEAEDAVDPNVRQLTGEPDTPPVRDGKMKAAHDDAENGE
jgi:hypothetical protein